MVTVRPGRGRSNVIFSTFTDSLGHIEVLPHDVQPLIGRVLDPALFDVTTLIMNRDDDAHRAVLPLIVQGRRPAGVSPLTRALRPGVSLSSIGAVAMAEPKAAAAAEGKVLAAMASAVTRAGAAAPFLTVGVSHVWLDQTVRVSAPYAARTTSDARMIRVASVANRHAVLDHNLAQIGAPVAWRGGDTGAGVKVAVLDTGVDAAFPDLRGQIVAEKNFTSRKRSVADHFGHGTFVASLIAGTGRAAGGERRGVAFGARLVIGKVLGDDGFGLDSSVIAGMQWAAARAKIINMSLGGLPSDGTDPLSLAVDHLTASHHVLFVIAAGNFGPADETVASPGAASAALTVGAVDGSDRLALFSSRGPRLGDFAIKPEITAPGVNIAGARAAGTTLGLPINADYTMASGTSFATPEVAGAAAILAAIHPGWSPARLKAALVSTAHRANGGDDYQQGGGRLDIAAEVTDPVTPDQAVADLGVVADGSTGTISHTLAWTNTSQRAVTIRLSAALANRAGHPAAAGTIGLSAVSLRVPAGATAATTLVVRPGALGALPGLYEGTVTARDGSKLIRTPVSLYIRPPTHTLTIHATPLPGTGAGGFSASVAVVDLNDPDIFLGSAVAGPDGTATLTVPDGHYWVVGDVNDNTNPNRPRSALMGEPDVTVSRDTTITFDGAAAVPVTASVTGRPTLTANASIHLERAFGGQVFGTDVFYFGRPTTTTVLFAQPTSTASIGSFHAYSTFRLVSAQSGSPRYVYDLYHSLGTRIPASAVYLITPAEQARLARVVDRFYAVGGNTSPVLETRFGLTAAGFLAFQGNSVAAGGSTRTDYLSAGPAISWNQEVSPPLNLPGLTRPGPWVIQVPAFQRYAPGSGQEADWARQPFAPGPYSATTPSVSFCAPMATTRTRGDIHAELTDLQDQPDGFDCLGGSLPLPPWTAQTSRIMRLYLGRTLVGTRHNSVADFTVPATSGTFRLTYTDQTSRALPVSTSTHTTWTFRSTVPAAVGVERLPLLLVRYALPLDLTNHQDGSRAVLTVSRIAGTPRAPITSVRLWTSTDRGRTWKLARIRALGGWRFAVTLSLAAEGQAVSLRVRAQDAGGSSVDQTITTAYRG
jgi:subtilisin family serine protease